MTVKGPERLESIEILGFRRLHDVKLRLKHINVLIGANGSGKSSLLDALSLLSHAAVGKLSERISSFGGIHSIATAGHLRPLSMILQMRDDAATSLHYGIEISPTFISHEITHEVLIEKQASGSTVTHFESRRGQVQYFDGERLVQPSLPLNPQESALSQTPNVLRRPEEIRRYLGSIGCYHLREVGPAAPVRLPQLLRPANLPGANAEDLVSCLYSMRETQKDRYEAIVDTLHAGFPTFERLDFPLVGAGSVAMTWKDAAFSQPFFMNQLSEGTLRFLWLVTLLQSPGLPAITLLDEPEVSLHPDLLRLLTDLFREASDRTQLIVATQSDGLIRFLEPADVVVFDLDDAGMARATPADQMDLEEWLEDYSLDEIWRLGRLGARP